ncbi:glutamyl-tRNA(Gln) amidotransferase subunit A, mitochondrial-like [Tubulanus polymorphus]|uniref:glutamyl-tRNA(Gln) amidotransferase subunit A, mitochondrial-like n=1 Tax=Tubulanus polymorphus TaxID=672921 RepID=UPI003DA447F8
MTTTLPSTIKEVVKLLSLGYTTPNEICKQCIKRMKSLNELNAFITETHDVALRQAEISTRRITTSAKKPVGLLDGIPIAIKDNFNSYGIQTTCASRMLAGYIPPYNATVVNKLLDAGAVIVGKTNMDEFAMGCGSTDSYYGPVRNPWLYSRGENNQSADWRVAGGSSGGSAVAVATGMCFASIGSDTGGSTRLPAALCGVVGLKPSYGLVSRHGLIPLVNSLDVPGIFAQCVDDAAIILNTIAGHDHLDSTTVSDTFKNIELPDEIDISKFHIGIPKEYHVAGLSKDVLNAWRRAADQFENAGARVSEVSLPHTEYALPCYSVLSTCEIASNMARFDGIEYGHRADVSDSTDALYAASRHEAFNEVIRGRILAGNYFLLKANYEKYFMHAMKIRKLISEDFKNAFNSGINVLLTPTSLDEATIYKDFISKDSRTQTAELDVFTQAANLSGIPAISVPTCLSSNSLPVGLQLMGPLYKEKHLLTAAKWLEQQANAPRLNISEQFGL